MSLVVSAFTSEYASRACPLTCSYAMSARCSLIVGPALAAWAMLFVTVHTGSHTYASRYPSDPKVTKIRSLPEGAHADRRWLRVFPEVPCSCSPPQLPSPSRTLG